MISVGMISLGCAKNRVNSEQMMYLLSKAGYHVTGDTAGVDVVVINTCSFVESAKEEAIEHIISLAGRKNDGEFNKLIVAGCLPERYKDEILRELPEIDAVIGTGSFDEIADVVKKVCLGESGHKCFGDLNSPVSETGRIISTSPVWAYLKIAEGCDNRCAYCCIPDIRGSFRSRPLENIVKEATDLANKGYKELNLVAQDVTAYGRDLYGKRSLTPLLRALGEIKELKWIRLLYLYPDGFDDELIDEIANSDKIVKYLDIPIQHINNNILRSMNRRGNADEIRGLFYKLRERIPGLVLRTSVITGLPGENEAEFKELCEFLREMKIQRAGVFAYSPQEGTQAARMKHPGIKTAESRASIIRRIQSRIMDDYNKSRIGTHEKVLVEGRDGDNLLTRSYAEAPDADGYIWIKSAEGNIVSDSNRLNDFITAKLTGIEFGEMIGKVI